MKKKVLNLLLVSTLLFTFTACGQKTIVRLHDSNIKTVAIDNVTMTISDISSVGATIVIKDTNSNTYVYSEWYKIEKEDNGMWKELVVKDKDCKFSDLGYKVDNDNIVKFTINWEKLYGKLSNGKYRIIKKVNNSYTAIEFTI